MTSWATIASLFFGMIEPGKCGRHEHAETKLLLVDPLCGGQVEAPFSTEVDVYCDMLNLSWDGQ